MKSQIFSAAVVVGLLAITLLTTLPASRGQATGSADEAIVATLIAEVSAQQAQMAENHAKIEEKLAEISENVRQARIFVARGGGPTK